MVFSSVIFLLYFLPAFLLIYYITPKKYKNPVLLLSSIFFYAWGAPKFIFVILGTTFVDFYLVQWMSSAENIFKKRLFLTLSVSLNLGLLVYFKYSNFFIENVNALLAVFGGSSIHWTKLILPIGISFYTFETITYVMDVYRGVHKPLDKFWDYQLYIILFPKLIAGPIVRFHEIADQLKDRSHNDTADNRLIGFYRFIIGLAKKVLIANQLGVYSDEIFGMNYLHLDGYTAWMGILAYTFQLYFDFSGYSDMAIGLAKMIGFKFPENFNNPYISQSVTEFWRRWHMTLGSWMKNYLYIPLGGNKVASKYRLYFNLGLVFLLSGLWHGASWSFIVWGAYHGFFLLMEKSFLSRAYDKIGKWPSMLFTFFIVVIGWVFFRVEKIEDAFVYISRLLQMGESSKVFFGSEFYFFLIIAVFFAFFASVKYGQKIQDAVYIKSYDNKRHIAMTLITMILFVLSLSSITSAEFNPFIYFRF